MLLLILICVEDAYRYMALTATDKRLNIHTDADTFKYPNLKQYINCLPILPISIHEVYW